MFSKVLIVCGSILAGLVFCSAPALAHETELRIGTDGAFTPFVFQKDGAPVGFDVDIWDAAAKIMGVRYRLQIVDFISLIPALQTHRLDGAFAGISITPERSKLVDFSAPYYQSGLSVLVRRDSKLTSSAQIDGAKVATKQATSSVEYLKAHAPRAEINSYPSIEAAYQELQSGHVDAVVFDSPVLAYYAATAGKGAAKLLAPPLSSGELYGFAFPQDSDLAVRFDAALKTMRENGQYQAIYEKWFGKAP